MDKESEKATSPFSFKDRLNMFEKSELMNKPPLNRSTKVSLLQREMSPPVPAQVPIASAINIRSPINNNLQQSMKQTEVDKKLFSCNSPTSRPLPVPPPHVPSPPKRDETKVQEVNLKPVQPPPKISEIKSPVSQFPKKRSFGKINEIKEQKPPSASQSLPTSQLPPVPPPPPTVQLPPVPPPSLITQLPSMLQPLPTAQLPSVPPPPSTAQLPFVPPPPPTAQLPFVPQPPSTVQPQPLAQSLLVGSTPPIVQPPPKLSDLKIQHKTLLIKPSLEINKIDDLKGSEKIGEQTFQLNSQTKRTLSPNGDKIIHPPLPPPPPQSLKTPENQSDSNLRPPDLTLPPLPPPPQSTVKISKKGNVLVGWVKPQNTESVTSDKKLTPPNTSENKIKSLEPNMSNIKTGLIAPNIMDNKTNKIDESDKPPPIVVPPPSLEVIRKIREREASPSSSNENPKSVRSSVQSAEINNEDQYDEDEDFSSEPWYFDISREEATKLMKNCLKKGTFLIRPSQNNQYVLMVRIETNEVKKFKIQKYNNGWILGDPSKAKKIHENLSTLVSYYLANGIKFGTNTLTLKEPFQKK